MQRIGRVLHISSSKKAILKAEKLPRIGDKVVNGKMKPVGSVFDIFGPISSPYVSVETKVGDLDRLVDRILYVVPSRQHAKRGRNRG